jgi:hypothetical protein
MGKRSEPWKEGFDARAFAGIEPIEDEPDETEDLLSLIGCS